MQTPQQAAQLKAVLDTIAWSEGTATSTLTRCFGYDVIVTGVSGPEVFTDLSHHPFEGGRHPKLVNAKQGLYSTAAGRYQLLLKWWLAYRDMLHLTDFSPTSQDQVAIEQLRERGALPLIYAGDIPGALTKARFTWASLPGNGYGQAGGHTMDALLTVYRQRFDGRQTA